MNTGRNDNNFEDIPHDPRIPVDERYKTEDVTNRKGLNFEEMGLKKELLFGIVEAGYEYPSPIQEDSIPLILKGENVIGRAKNGTGKTMAYGIPILHLVDPNNPNIQAIIIVNTRELSLQVSKSLKEIGKHIPNLNIMNIMGGEKVSDDINRLKQRVQILVSTPGRLIHFIQERYINISSLKILAIDEADQVIQLNEDILKSLASIIPPPTQKLMFSASFPNLIQTFCDEFIRNPKKVNTMNELTLKGVTQYYIYLEEKDKFICLKYLFSTLAINQCMIFVKSSYRAIMLSKQINKDKITCFVSHHELHQEDRNKIFHGFREGQFRYLVCTDFLSRGVDVQSVNVVINFDIANSSVKHLHRVGRSGRFGHLGLAITFVTDRDKETFFRIEKELGIDTQKMPEKVDKSLYS